MQPFVHEQNTEWHSVSRLEIELDTDRRGRRSGPEQWQDSLDYHLAY